MPSCTALWTHEGGQPALREPERGVMNFVKKTTALTPKIPEGNFFLIPFPIIGAIIPSSK
jgi:hypothetical protein